MLGDATEAEDVVQDTFGRLAHVDLDELQDIQGWLTVVVRRLCLDRIRSARFRHESTTSQLVARRRHLAPTGTSPPTPPIGSRSTTKSSSPSRSCSTDSPPQNAPRLSSTTSSGSPTPQSARPSDARPSACRQLASRARRAIREGSDQRHDDVRRADIEDEQHRAVSERFIEACAGGDISTLMQVLDPDVVGEATIFGFGPLLDVSGTAGHRAAAPRPVRTRHRNRAHSYDSGTPTRRHRVRTPARRCRSCDSKRRTA